MSAEAVLDLGSLFGTLSTGVQEQADRVDRLISAFWPDSDPATSGFAESDLSRAEDRLGTALPAALRSAYARWGRCDGLSVQDRLIPPDRLEIRGGVLVFRIENQGAAGWGVGSNATEEDPPVLLTTDVRTPSWRDDLGTVSEFFVHIALSEAVLRGHLDDNCAVDHDEALLAAVEEHYEELIAPRFLWWPDPDLPAVRFFGGPDVLIADHARTWLWVGALTPAALDRVRRVVPGDWQFAT